MNKNPFLHALGAALYIVITVFVIDSFKSFEFRDTLLVPMVMLSLFVISAAVMGYLFLSQPLQLYFDNKKCGAITFFGKTVASFAGLALILVALLFYPF
ncbi:MAG: hypothetical protein AAB641_00500 [Patescibacteria group bacterium]